MDLRDDDDVYWHLQRSEREYFVAQDIEQSREPTWTADVTKSDRFIAIGWLVESNQAGFHRTTNYVCCLNLSTKPMSLWLIYDYRQPDPEQVGVVRTADVPDRQSSYNDPAWDHEESHTSCKSTGEATRECHNKSSLLNQKRAGYMEQDAPWDVACLYNDVGDWPKDEKLATEDAGIIAFGLAGKALRVKHEKLNRDRWLVQPET